MKKYQRVKIVNDKYIKDGIKKGNIGYILEIYDQNYSEVEFSNIDGSTITVQVINKSDFILIDD